MEFLSDLLRQGVQMNISLDLPGLLEAVAGQALLLLIALTRLALPVLGLTVLIRCAWSLLRGKNAPEVWGWLYADVDARLPICHWENIIGRGRSSDILINLPTISRSHAALIRDKEGQWTIIDLSHKGAVKVNGQAVDSSILRPGDELTLAESRLRLAELSPEEEEEQRQTRERPGGRVNPLATLGWLTLFIFLLGLEISLAVPGWKSGLQVGLCFFLLMAALWAMWLLSRGLRRTGFEIETLGFFLTAIGLAVTASSAPSSLPRQALACGLGLLLFLGLGWALRDIRRVKALRWPAAGAALAALAYVLLKGEVIFGARNWINIFGVSFQPSELVKVAFIFAGAATLDRLFARRNLYSFIFLTLGLVGMLALMSDFGTAAIFFAAFIIIAYLRSGDLATVALSLAGAVMAAIVALAAKPYIAERFAAWGQVWAYVNDSGYQQTRAMSALASGGFFGLGGGQGWLKYVAAADTDLVFAYISEEWGVLLALIVIASLVVMALFAVKAAANARSAYYVIAACGAMGMLLVQTLLNVGGSLDLLPLTGVTLPFVSHGGSSLISCWGLLAFLKAVDTRQNASFATSLLRLKRRQAPPPQSPFDDPDWQVNEDE